EATEGALGLMPAHAHAPKPGAVGLSGTNEVDLSEAAMGATRTAEAHKLQAVARAEGRSLPFEDALKEVKE
ncbi:MAG: hypothetical protein KAI66_27390, partial [Lentisphaeria bacterium]|nr:hypothetical protein [Lentisphaeria bacterium]